MRRSVLCDQVTGVPRKHQIVDLPLTARTKVDHFVDVNKMDGHAAAIDLKITKIEKRTSSGGAWVRGDQGKVRWRSSSVTAPRDRRSGRRSEIRRTGP